MKCKKCGCDTLIKTDDWYKCANCGAVIFDTNVSINDAPSPTKEMEKIDDAELAASKQESVEDEEKSGKKGKKGKKNKDKKEKSKARETVEFFIPVICALIIALLLKTFVFANAVVPTGSMLNTIQEGDRIIAGRIAYINSDPERYDVIIFEYPDDESQYYVKRVIGLPGETVQIIDGIVYVTQTNGETIQLDDSFVTNCEPEGSFGPYEVPEDFYFVMGDNRNNSWDSRYWENKYVSKDKITGKVKFRYYPSISTIE
ncbi:MAG: signal peptidase I [Clostridiales bacterium]|nr:signal peptidase I [Clostridiales bacterium]